MTAPIRWLPNGYFDCTSGDVRVKGVAADPETVREFLRRAGIVKAATSTFRARSDAEDIGHNHEAFRAASDFGADIEQKLATPPGSLITELERIRDCLPRATEELAHLLRERAKQLNTVAPQVYAPRVFDARGSDDRSYEERYAVPDSPDRGYASWVDWIDPALIISTPDKTWNKINRRPDSVLHIAQALALADSTHALSIWITTMFWSLDDDYIKARRLEGPAGPIYHVSPGTHRAHALRLLDIPAALTLVRASPLPRPATPGQRQELSAWAGAALWSGLKDRGVVDAEVCGDQWHFHSIAAEWMLASPGVATQVNGAYERLYPGALQKVTGMSLSELTDPDRWIRALTGR